MPHRFIIFTLLLSASPAAADDSFPKFADDYYSALFNWDPVQATYAGIHDRDSQLPDLSASNIARRREELGKLQLRLKPLLASKLAAAELLDAEILDSAIRAEILELDTVRDWKRNPMVYLGKPAEGIDLLMKRNFAPEPERLKLIIGRLKAAPRLLDAMKANVENPPKEFADLALIIAKGSAGFFKTDLPAWAKTAGDQELREAERSASGEVGNRFGETLPREYAVAIEFLRQCGGTRDRSGDWGLHLHAAVRCGSGSTIERVSLAR